MSFKIALVQMRMSGDVAENTARAVEWVEQAAAQGGQVICLPEMFRTPYFCQVESAQLFDLAEPAQGPSFEALRKVAAARGVCVIVPIFEKRAPGVYHNSAVYIGRDGELLGVYRKMHIPDDPGFYEKFYFTPGDLGFRVFNPGWGPVGTLICWDQWFPEGARATALRGAQALFYPTAIGWLPTDRDVEGPAQLDAWITIQRSHAIANGCYVAAANRVGLEKAEGAENGIEFWGNSFIADPQGVILARASADKEEIITADVDEARIEAVRRGWPYLRDRRIDAYGDLAKRFIEE
jgi:N-carbamoylputrescine amidase